MFSSWGGFFFAEIDAILIPIYSYELPIALVFSEIILQFAICFTQT